MMLRGTAKWFNDAKGFGFLEPDGGGPDVFAHFSAIDMDGSRTLKQGAQVSFEMLQGPKGNLAHNIRALVTDTECMPLHETAPIQGHNAMQTA